MILFILYMVLFISQQTSEKQEILNLNQQLQQDVYKRQKLRHTPILRQTMQDFVQSKKSVVLVLV